MVIWCHRVVSSECVTIFSENVDLEKYVMEENIWADSWSAE